MPDEKASDARAEARSASHSQGFTVFVLRNRTLDELGTAEGISSAGPADRPSSVVSHAGESCVRGAVVPHRFLIPPVVDLYLTCRVRKGCPS